MIFISFKLIPYFRENCVCICSIPNAILSHESLKDTIVSSELFIEGF